MNPTLLRRRAIAIVLVSVSATTVWGQGRATPRYVPSTPSISPYLGLLSNQGGALPNYYSLVRPLQRQASINQTQAYNLQRQSGELEQARFEFGQLETAPTGTTAWFLNLPSSGGFQDRTHYYGQWDARRNLPGAQRRGRR